MSQNEITGMVLVALTAIIGLMIIVARTTWNVSKTNTEISSTLKILLKISDNHEKKLEQHDAKLNGLDKDLELVKIKCNFAHKIDD